MGEDIPKNVQLVVQELERRFPGQVSVLAPGEVRFSQQKPPRLLNLSSIILVLCGITVFAAAMTSAQQSCHEILLQNGGSSADIADCKDQPPWLSFAQMVSPGVLAFLLTVAVAIAFHKGLRRAKRSYDAQFAVANSERFILYLRSFADDGSASNLENVVVQKLRAVAPIVAIDNVNTPGLSGGGIRIRASNDAWQTAVALLSRNALGVVIDARTATPGLLYEVDSHLAGDRCSDVLILTCGENGESSVSSSRIDAMVHRKHSNAVSLADWATTTGYRWDGQILTRYASETRDGHFVSRVLDEFQERLLSMVAQEHQTQTGVAKNS